MLRNKFWHPCGKEKKETIHTQDKDTNDWGLHAEYLAEAWYVHASSIKPIFYGSSMMSLFEAQFKLRCFQLLLLEA